MGRWWSGPAAARWASHASSLQVWWDRKTTDAVSGGHCAANAMGSALSRHTPSGSCNRNLYRSPVPIPSIAAYHTPLLPSGVMATPSNGPQPVVSEITRTAQAFGAHTENAVPPSYGWAPSTVHSRSWRPWPNRCRSSSPGFGITGVAGASATAGTGAGASARATSAAVAGSGADSVVGVVDVEPDRRAVVARRPVRGAVGRSPGS